MGGCALTSRFELDSKPCKNISLHQFAWGQFAPLVVEADKAVVEREPPAAVRSYGKALVDLKERLRLQRMSATFSSAPVAQLPSLTLLPLCA